MKIRPTARQRLALFALLFAHSLCVAQDGLPRLKEVFEDDFLMGAALKEMLFEDSSGAALKLVERHFNSVSSCNMLKWGPLNPKPGVFEHELADAYVDFGNRNKMYVVGHVLFWHNQTPKWVFKDAQGRGLSRHELLARMHERVKHVAERYGNRLDAWDVVNECILYNGQLRDSRWTQIIGEDFIEQAFRIADAEMPRDVELLYNDYSMTKGAKREAVVRMVRRLKKKGVRIDGVGMQAHWKLDRPSIEEIEASIMAFSAAGVDVHITELDIDVLPRKKGLSGADIAARNAYDVTMNPYRAGMPPDIQQKLAERYAEIFRLFLKHRDKIKRVTFWGVTDADSWLNDWPVEGRTNHPLLFDRQGRAKPAFDSLVEIKAGEFE